MLGFDIAGFFGIAPDRQPAIAFALLVQDIAKPEEPGRAASIGVMAGSAGSGA